MNRVGLFELMLTASAMLAGASIGCVRGAPGTQVVDWDEEECASTEVGKACLTLLFYASQDVRKGSEPDNWKKDLAGKLHWGVYKGGDVGLFGPGDSPKIFEGETDEVKDLLPDDSDYYVHIPNAMPMEYQVLSYLDDDDSGESNAGDAVTFPSDAFRVPADKQTIVDVRLDTRRP